MSDFESAVSKDGLTVKLWRGERMCLLGFDVDAPEPDFVGFAVEVRSPGSPTFYPLRNRLAFSYDHPVDLSVNGFRNFDSTEAPFQKFRWVHFPYQPKPGTYTYRVTKMHMPLDAKPIAGTQHALDISLAPVTYDGFVDVGFTRNFASSQAFEDRYPNMQDIIPNNADDGLAFTKKDNTDVYQWLGFEAYDLLFGFLDEAVADPSVELDVLAYDLNEPDIVGRLEQLGQRLRIVIDDSTSTRKRADSTKVTTGHGTRSSAESKAATRLRASAGAARVQRTHFQGLQHHKVFIAKRGGKPFKVLAGSTNFSFRGIYIQANNLLVFSAAEVAALYGQMFERAFGDPDNFEKYPIATKWHLVDAGGTHSVQVCFSPHKSSDLSLNPVRGAIDQATSSVLYSVAFLNQIASGPTREAFDRLMKKSVFSYGVVNERGNLEVKKPDGSIGLVDFAYLAKKAPEPFKTEWSGGKGINIHHKFVVTDFSLPTAKVFTGSSNLAPSGEKGNGDHLIEIDDRKIAFGYAIEALRVFDHLHFRSRMQDAAKKAPKAKLEALTLRKPTALSGKPAWFEPFYVADSYPARDRALFAR